jgi:hypothetical protein
MRMVRRIALYIALYIALVLLAARVSWAVA